MGEHPRRRVKGSQGVVDVGSVLAGVYIVGGSVEVVGGGRVEVVVEGCAGTGRVINGLVMTRRESESHVVVTPFDGCKEDERRGVPVRVTYRNVINTFDERKWQSHDPG